MIHKRLRGSSRVRRAWSTGAIGRTPPNASSSRTDAGARRTSVNGSQPTSSPSRLSAVTAVLSPVHRSGQCGAPSRCVQALRRRPTGPSPTSSTRPRDRWTGTPRGSPRPYSDTGTLSGLGRSPGASLGRVGSRDGSATPLRRRDQCAGRSANHRREDPAFGSGPARKLPMPRPELET
jgi:hypothetical protein